MQERPRNIQAQEASETNIKTTKLLQNQRSARFAKNDSRYWLSRILKPANDRGIVSPYYSMQIQFKGHRLAFSLGTGNKEAAARKAAGIYVNLLSLGVPATLAKHKPRMASKSDERASIGEWIAAAQKVFDCKPATFGGYARGLRFIASEILAVSKTKKRYGRAL